MAYNVLRPTMLPPTPTSTPPESPHLSKRPLSRSAFTGSSAPLQQLPPLVTALPESHQPQFTIEAFSRPGGPLAAPPHLDLSPPPSPTRSTKKDRWSFIRTNSRREPSPDRRSDHGKPPKLADWFQGESRPVRIGVLPSPTREIADPMPLTAQPAPTPARPARAGNPFLALFSPKASSSSTSLRPSPAPPSAPADPLLSLDIPAALAPPATLDAAVSLATDLQSAHRALAAEHNGLAAEFAVQTDELAEARTRAQHFQTQLRDVANQLAERDAMVDALREALAREAEKRAATLRIVDPAEGAAESARAVDMSRAASLSSASVAPSVVFSEAGHESVSSVSDVEVEAPEPMLRTRPAPEKAGAVRGREMQWREENEALRARVHFLEAELDGCLEMVAAIGL